MRLKSLRLQSFRNHTDTTVNFNEDVILHHKGG